MHKVTPHKSCYATINAWHDVLLPKRAMNKTFFFKMAVKEVSAADENGYVRVKGYASTPDLDRYRDIVEPEAFSKALKGFMKNPVVLRSHDADRPVGEIESASVTSKGLWVEAIVKEEATAKDVASGLFRAFSIGYIPKKTEIRNKDNEPLGDNDSIWAWDNIRIIKELDLVEISIVSTPANASALFTLAKSLQQYTRQLAMKSFDTGAPKEQKDVEEPEEDEEEDVEEEENEAGDEEEKTTPEAPADDEEPEEEAVEDTQPKDTTTEEAKPSTEEAGNEGGTPSADGGEGAKATEEPKADAKPEEEAEPEGESEEGKAIVLAKDDVALLPSLKAVGAIREPEGEEVPAKVSKQFVSLLKKLHDGLESENKRANEEKDRADKLQAKLNAIPEKKALAPHRQFGSEMTASESGEAKKVQETSEWFKSLFKSR